MEKREMAEKMAITLPASAAISEALAFAAAIVATELAAVLEPRR